MVYHLNILGKDVHAGTNPMEARKDPVKITAPLISKAYTLADEYLPDIRLTFGDLRPSPGVVNTVPSELVITVDISHPDDEILDRFEEKLN